MKKTYKFLYKGELCEANRRAIKAKCNSIDPEYVDRLPDDMRYPVYFSLPYERHGWVRCQIGTATRLPADDFTALLLDVPTKMFDKLSVIEVCEN